MKLSTNTHFRIVLFISLIFSFENLQAQKKLDVNVLEPQNNQPALYQKIEWGIQLPPQIEKAVSNWIKNDQNKSNISPALNPFDPSDLDLTGTIEYMKDGKPVFQQVFGFYYRDYQRITKYNNPDNLPNMDDPDNWFWKEAVTDKPLRIRWAPDAEGDFILRVRLNTRGFGSWESEPVSFSCKGGDRSDSFVSISDNKHFFKTDDQKVFLPIGLNITEASFGCNCKEGVNVTDNCTECYEWGSNDPCCGIKNEKKHRSGIPGTQLLDYTLAVAAYEKLEDVLSEIKKSGGNSFRTFLDPMAFEIEFEKMNNYYDRQYQAWEFDRMLDQCNKLDLRVELNMQYHYSVAYHSYGMDRFDWDDTYNCQGCGKDFGTTGTKGWCYNNECPEVEDPVDFLTNECALNNYKKKIRYIIARWGYSRNIFVMELMSEMNNIGHGSVWEVNIDTDNDGQKDDNREISIPSLYYADARRTRPAVAFWHNEIARYIKEDLQHNRHLIAADYTGTAPMTADLNMDGDCNDAEIGENCNPCQNEIYDNSWMSANIDVMAFSNYTGSLNRWEKMAVHEYSKNSQSEGLMCGWNDPDTKEDDGKLHSPLGSYESLWKPVIHAENGLTSCLSDDYSGFVKDMLADAFGGHATSGMSWDEWSNTENWHFMGKINQFITKQVIDSINFGKGNWTPNHSYSSRKGEFAKTKFAESIYMLSPDKQRVYGYVINRSWNYYTTGRGSCVTPDRKNDFRGADAPLATLTKINGNSDELIIKGTKSGKFVVRYYDPMTGALVKEVKFKGKKNKFELHDYPVLGDGKSGEQPFYFFVIYPQGGRFAD